MLDRLLISFIFCVERTLEYICTLLHNKHGSWELPQELVREISRCLLPDIVEYCESEEGKAEFIKWSRSAGNRTIRQIKRK